MKNLGQISIVLLLTTFCSNAFAFQASVDEYHMLGTNLNFTTDSVTGKIQRIKTPEVDEVSADVKGQIVGQDLELTINKTPFSIKDLGQFFQDIENGKLTGFNFENGQRNIVTSMTELNGTSEADKILIKGVKGNCHISANTFPTYDDFLLNTCLTNATLNMAEFHQANNAFINRVLGFKAASEVKLSKLNAQVSNHNLRLKVKVKTSVSVTAKIEGKVEYLADQKTISIRIDKAKASFFNIKKKVFEELEKLKEPKLTVKRPYVYIKLN